jgi:radical SAM protein
MIKDFVHKYREKFVYDKAPMLVYWESTQACDLSCIHCRASACHEAQEGELSTWEAKKLLKQISKFGDRPPHLVITGGDPLKRDDLFHLISYGKELGINISITPAGTSKLTPYIIKAFEQIGVSSIALSLDGSNAERHDQFRRVNGSFNWTMRGIKSALDLGLSLQINTMVTAETVDDLPNILELLKSSHISRWALFFLIQTGRGSSIEGISPQESEKLLNWVCSLTESGELAFPIKTTEAHHYRRVAFERMSARGFDEEMILNSPLGHGFGIRDGNGIVFISHRGEIFPSGFLPLEAGNIRECDLVETYRDHELFTSLRNPDEFTGKCGECAYRWICGGSRARAFATHQNPLDSDALCPYQPNGSRDLVRA